MAREHSGIINLMNIILLFSILVPLTVSPASENQDFVYFLVTALFMADAEGKYVLLDKALPISVEDVIKEHVLSHLNSTIRNKAIIKVVPKPAHLQPFQFHRNTMRLNLEKMASRKNFMDTIVDGLRNFWDYDIMHKGGGKSKKKINLSKDTKPYLDAKILNKTEKVENFVKIEKVEKFNKTEKTKQLDKAEGSDLNLASELIDKSVLAKKSNVTKGQPTSPNDYVPNDIYYSIEKKCVNWSAGCQLKSPPIFDHPSSVFKFSLGVLVPPKFELWDP